MIQIVIISRVIGLCIKGIVSSPGKVDSVAIFVTHLCFKWGSCQLQRVGMYWLEPKEASWVTVCSNMTEIILTAMKTPNQSFRFF